MSPESPLVPPPEFPPWSPDPVDPELEPPLLGVTLPVPLLPPVLEPPLFVPFEGFVFDSPSTFMAGSGDGSLIRSIGIKNRPQIQLHLPPWS